ncbi:MAG: GNAT family N-acetyltransferase [Chloroflexi bacterium]|uniref:GNAT family N-acetyltransferase n=1 Tax=Candidatus Chlorohelix allophototropha TaxID=3003348 RepID=A0A8T7M8X4_9CHLR|nr:GNAT family N-acetyltransferase [Chloroflexota bacterium]WJW68548.1 GNAT family N-acetyltransferase [Chloroflexota bacterium L227-S17]
MIIGEKINLRPYNREDVRQFAALTNDLSYSSEFNFFGLRSPEMVEHSFEEDGFLHFQRGRLVVTIPEGTVVGMVSYHLLTYGPNDGSRVYNIGITLMQEQRGRGYGTEAQSLLAHYLLATYPIMRVEATTDVENLPEQRSLEKAGFTREGVLRKAQWRNGEHRDIVVYSKLRGE